MIDGEESELKFVEKKQEAENIVLPRLVTNFLSENQEMSKDVGSLRKTFTAIMKSHGFGRNASRKYGEGPAPAWWDSNLVAWDSNLNGVNEPTNWKSLNRGPWTKALYEQIKNCYLSNMTYDDAEEVDEFEPVDEVENVVEFETVECMNEIRQEELETCEFANDTREMINNIDFNVNESFSIIENIVNDNISINQIFDDNCADTVKNTKEKSIF